MWLKREPLRTMWYQHSQPPGFNALSSLLLATGRERVAAAILFHLLGATLVVGVLLLSRRLGLTTRWSVVLASIVCLRPDVLLYEHWYFYTFIEAWILVAVLAVLATIGRSAPIIRLAPAALGIASLAAMHALFGVVWVAGLGALLSWRFGWRRTMALVGPAMLLLGAITAKNWVLFDQAAISSWQGTNLSRITTYQLSEAERRRLVRDRSLTESALLSSWSKNWDDPLLDQPAGEPGPSATVDVLDQTRKPTGGELNYNNRRYLPSYENDLDDALWVIRHRPTVWLHAVWQAWGVYFKPADDNLRMIDNIDSIAAYRSIWRVPLAEPYLSSGQFDHDWIGDSWRGVQFSEIALFALAASAFPLRRRRRARNNQSMSDAEGLCLTFLTWAVVATPVLANAVEIGENNRFRFALVPITAIGAALALRELALWYSLTRDRRRRHDSSTSSTGTVG